MSTEDPIVEAPVDTPAVSTEPTESVETPATETKTPPPVPVISYQPGDKVTLGKTTYIVQREGNWVRETPKVRRAKKIASAARKKAGHNVNRK